ncbi:MAG TPA: UDP-2,3-diacylglucosamine diphosphatase, partial [Betaproteobacteria bacterium]|nr:UDP-2,3-diacylglucosamine diphosphatase [Betaproteobacteria bacterium]
TLLSHGDAFCTLDRDYQQFRATVRRPAWQREFLARPLTQRKAEIETLRRHSMHAKGQKAAAATDVAPQAIGEALRRHRCHRLIHGHTHRPARHIHRIDDRDCERWVLPSWDDYPGGYLRCDANGCAWDGNEALKLTAH